ncbi:hypothetical protein GCM10007160_37770 [Litchfieldella qijiaojingensis]|uniref:Glycosyltransferase 61 catalytic domain-containing protein n=1 Tax=Litchfieldella qijiaojingensis TaxID=980347 RepID=A0ABQ2ZA10_9GAMM|nr:glycosyltransferase family 61 protein [Halomonas qijiaojingensis]GGY06649.1 hypothetical protein GCM10007160_37770 [Halomonas qijiaojingensis]
MDEKVFENYSIVNRKRNICKKTNVFVGRAGYVIELKGGKNGSYHSEYNGLKKELFKLSLCHAIRYGVDFKNHNVSGLIFHNPWSSGYYHWLIEAMPRLLALKDEWGRYPIVIPPKVPNTWFKKWLTDISCGRYVELKSGITFFKEVIYQDNPGKMSQHSTPDLKVVSDYFSSLALRQIKHAGNFQKIYISRKNAGHRKISNEDEVEIFLKRVGFEFFQLENMNFLEQVLVFFNAKCVVSIHGAGLSNILFMRPGAKVIELIQQPDPKLTWGSRRGTYLLNPCFKSLAESRSLDYKYILCEYDEDSTPLGVLNKHGALHGNIKVSVNSLKRTLIEVI